MPKSLHVDPDSLRRAGRLEMPEIAVHTPPRPFEAERAARGDAALIGALRHMVTIRAFETMLADFKAHGRHGGVEHAYKGPAHLSVGQEGAAVGAALALAPGDHIFGSHRSHGEFLAKALAAADRLPEGELTAMMAAPGAADIAERAAAHLPASDTREQAGNFLLFGFLSEIFMRRTGFNGGMGGSMHAFFTPVGAYPNNAIVGASAGIAAGAALRRHLAGEGGITVAMAGDGATGCGPVWEAMNFAAMGQFSRLWQDRPADGLPVVFLFNNNFYAMGGQTMGETMGWDRLARVGAGIAPSGLHAETVDGTDVLAVAAATERQRDHLLAGRGPGLLDVESYRQSGHSSSDANAYRTKEEISAWAAHDPIASLSGRLIEAGAMTEADFDAMQAETAARIERVAAAAADPQIAPPVDVAAEPTTIGRRMFTHRRREPADAPQPTLIAPERCARIRQNAKKARHGLAEDGTALSPMRAITLRDGLFEAILHHMLREPALVAWGEECREWGGAFGVYRGLSELFPHERLFNAPISEAAIVAAAIGHAMEGGRSLAELMYADFIGRAGDEILNQLAKWQGMSDGALSLPVVLRTSVGSKYGAQHSQDWSALIAHVPGLKVIYPATARDAKGLMAEALSGEDPVVAFESQRLYDKVETLHPDGVPEAYFRIPIGQPEVKRPGRDATILTIGPALYPAIEAAGAMAADPGIEAEVIDARSLVPFDHAPVIDSVRRTGRLLIVTEASERGSIAQTMAATVTRHAFADLAAPPRVLGAPNWIVPGADMETTYFPQAHDIVDAVRADLLGEAGYARRGLRGWDDLALARAGL